MIFPHQTRAAVHTLWQAAVASGGLTAIVQAVSDGSVLHVNELKQGAGVVGIAVLASGFSVLKAFARNWLNSHKQSEAAKAATELQALAAQVADYNAKHTA